MYIPSFGLKNNYFLLFLIVVFFMFGIYYFLINWNKLKTNDTRFDCVWGLLLSIFMGGIFIYLYIL